MSNVVNEVSSDLAPPPLLRSIHHIDGVLTPPSREDLVVSALSVSDETGVTSFSAPAVTLVLDASGSMLPIRADIITAVNNFIDKQATVAKDDSHLSLVVFSNEASVRFQKRPMVEAIHISDADYVCDGVTALHDAIATAININEGEKNVLIVIVTDGEENASKISYLDIQAKIQAKKNDGWNFIYLANEPRISLAGTHLGMPAAVDGVITSNTNNIAVGFEHLPTTLSRGVSSAVEMFRSTSAVPNLNELTRANSSPL